MTTIKQLEKEIDRLKARNRRVETDKAWETSVARKVIVAMLTYVVVLSFFLINQLPNPFINSLIPTIAFFLSTLTLPFFKTIWLEHHSLK